MDATGSMSENELNRRKLALKHINALQNSEAKDIAMELFDKGHLNVRYAHILTFHERTRESDVASMARCFRNFFASGSAHHFNEMVGTFRSMRNLKADTDLMTDQNINAYEVLHEWKLGNDVFSRHIREYDTIIDYVVVHPEYLHAAQYLMDNERIRTVDELVEMSPSFTGIHASIMSGAL